MRRRHDDKPDTAPDAPPLTGRGRGRRPTRQEHRERVIYAVELLACRAYRSEVVALMRRRFGICSKTCDRYLSKARDLMRRQAAGSVERHRRNSVAFWISVIRRTSDRQRTGRPCTRPVFPRQAQ